MLQSITDENVRDRIIRGVRRRLPSLDLVRARDVGLKGCRNQSLECDHNLWRRRGMTEEGQ